MAKKSFIVQKLRVDGPVLLGYTILRLNSGEGLTMNQLTIFIVRAVVGLAFAAIVTRIFFGRIDPVYVVGLAIIMVGLAYLAEYLRGRRTK